jgi:micrococcal nuclease
MIRRRISVDWRGAACSLAAQAVAIPLLVVIVAALNRTGAAAPRADAPAPTGTGRYDATVVRVIDGDTVVADVEVAPAWRLRAGEVHLRLLGVNSPELHAPDPKPGLAAKAYTASRLMGRAVVITARKADSFGRWLSKVELDGADYNAELLASGHAAPFMVEKE